MLLKVFYAFNHTDLRLVHHGNAREFVPFLEFSQGDATVTVLVKDSKQATVTLHPECCRHHQKEKAKDIRGIGRCVEGEIFVYLVTKKKEEESKKETKKEKKKKKVKKLQNTKK